MLKSVFSAANSGVDGFIVTVECNVLDIRLDKYEIVGLPDAAVKEAKERVRTAFENSGFRFPESGITVDRDNGFAELKENFPHFESADSLPPQVLENSKLKGTLLLDKVHSKTEVLLHCPAPLC